MKKEFRICNVEELDHDKPRCFRVNGRSIFLVRHWAEIYALDNRCGHMNVPLHRGEYTDGLIVCGLHGAAFRVDSGEVEWDAILPPPMSEYSSSNNARIREFGELTEAVETLPVEAFPVTIQGDDVYITMCVSDEGS
ncbi:MAG TPA: Rieske 2Fe-2S domain-containing protein [Aggregatilineales bacterium]|nr:Rieske 2Fe-2S domain-containing protein [Aggregatilineales bacterium]